jgi:hypothetical protein
MEKKIVRLTANADVVQFLSNSGNLSSQLPEWKRGVLEASSKASNSEPRQPVSRSEQDSTKSTQKPN